MNHPTEDQNRPAKDPSGASNNPPPTSPPVPPSQNDPTVVPQAPSSQKLVDDDDAGHLSHPFSLELDESVLPPDITPLPRKKSYQPAKKKIVKEKIPMVNMVIKFIIAFAIIAVSVTVSILIILSIQDIMGFSKGSDTVEIHVKEGEGLFAVAQKMEDEGLIRSSLLFRSYLRVFVKREITIHYGKYVFTQNMAYAQIIETLESKAEQSAVHITVVEGQNVAQIAERLEDLSICPASDFIEAVNHGEWLDKDGNQRFSVVEDLLEIPDLDQRPFRLEGYLFPDTYNFKTGTPAEEVVARFLANFEKKFDSHLRYLTRQSGYSVDEIIRLASIVEGEASGTDMMPRVASVYWNRLENAGMFPKLQADPTTRYARDVLAPLGVSQDVLTAYDTYQSEGLPMGPINNPGIKAIEATLKPADEDYYFFVTSKNMQIFYFAKTYEKHKENIEKARKNEAVDDTEN